MLIEQLPWWLRIGRGMEWRRDAGEKKIYLSFDDGPIPQVTPWVLDLLDRYQIKATFFCVGENVSKHPDVYQEILRRGHRTGNHSYNHVQGLKMANWKYYDNIQQAAALIHSPLYRPPHGIIRPSQLRYLRKHYQLELSDVVPRDYSPRLNGQQVLDKACHYVRNGSIIVFHDSLKAEKNLRYALPLFIEFCLKQGWQFELLY
ncbi:MAG: polysaccharide deacetylase family protein [Bacteroidales bacterium]|nr:polysaccharide deacetylase family protein [Bacteroidales bacterium]